MDQPPPKETRVPVNLRIKFRSETIEQFVDRYAVDVSRGGIFIRTREPLAVGTQLKFDFQLQNTTPLMAGEGTVVWIREHDPGRAGVTPGMGVRFDKLTAASQPVLDRILADKARREPGAPNPATAAAPAPAPTGKSGVGPLPARRPSSAFSSLDPGGLGVPAVAQPPGSAAVTTAAQTGSTLPFGSVPGALSGLAPTLKPLVSAAPASSPGSGLRPMPVAPAAGAGSGLRPMPTPPVGAPAGIGKGLASSPGPGPGLEGQSALGRLATGPNLSAFSSVAPRSSVPLPKAAGDASAPLAGVAGTPAAPTPVEDSERTQIADGLPDFARDSARADAAHPDFANSEPTAVGGQTALGVADVVAGRGPTITATSRRIPTPPPGPKLSLDAGVGSGVRPLPAAAPAGATAEPASANRTTSPDGSISPDGPAAPVAGRLSAAGMPAVGPGGPVGTGVPGAIDTDLARTVPAAERMSAITTAMRSTTPPANPRVPEKRRPVAAIVVGVLVGAAVAVFLVIKLTSGGDGAGTPAGTSASAPAPAAAPVAPATANPPAPSNPEGTAAAPAAATAPANPNAEPKPGEAPIAAGAKPGETSAPETKPEAKTAEPKPAEPAAPAVAEAGAPKPNRKPRFIAHKKAGGSKAEAALEAAAATGGDDSAAAADGPGANMARIISLPTGAEVLIDGQSVGKTPFAGKDIDPASPHALTVRKDGFETYEHMVSPSDWMKGKGPGQSLKVAVKLRKTKATGEAEPGAEKKGDKTGEPAAESGKTEPPPAVETP